MSKKKPDAPPMRPLPSWEQFDAPKRAEQEARKARAVAELNRHLIFSAKLNEDGQIADPRDAEILQRVFSADALREAFNGMPSDSDVRQSAGQTIRIVQDFAGCTEEEALEAARVRLWQERGVGQVLSNLDAVQSEVRGTEEEAQP
jgi:hypothetical protein